MRITEIERKAKKLVEFALDSYAFEDYEPDGADDDTAYEAVHIGTVFSITPSGKVYTPFANSNVVRCPRCHGSGTIKPKTANPDRFAELEAQVFAESKKLVDEYGAWCEGRWPKGREAELDRLRKLKDRVATTSTCPLCNGIGSREAYEDEVFNETLEGAASDAGCWIDHRDEDYFLVREKETVDEEDAE